jgi:hypothetical protein
MADLMCPFRSVDIKRIYLQGDCAIFDRVSGQCALKKEGCALWAAEKGKCLIKQLQMIPPG